MIITADKDFMQLVGPHVTLWDTMRDKSHRRARGARALRRRAAALVDILALMGDAIDNVKGVPGVGEKTAAALIQKFGSVEGNLYANLERLEESEEATRREEKSRRCSPSIVRAMTGAQAGRRSICEVPLEVGPDEFAWTGDR